MDTVTVNSYFQIEAQSGDKNRNIDNDFDASVKIRKLSGNGDLLGHPQTNFTFGNAFWKYISLSDTGYHQIYMQSENIAQSETGAVALDALHRLHHLFLAVFAHQVGRHVAHCHSPYSVGPQARESVGPSTRLPGCSAQPEGGVSASTFISLFSHFYFPFPIP